MKKSIIALLLFILFGAGAAVAYDFNLGSCDAVYYFADDGSGSTCSEGSPCRWISDTEYGYSSGTTANSKIASHGSTDTVCILLKRGDTWQFDTDAVTTENRYGFEIGTSAPTVWVGDWGSSGDPAPIMDGMTTFSAGTPTHNASTGPVRWSKAVFVERHNCKFHNLHIKNYYGDVFGLGASATTSTADGVEIKNCTIENFGYSFFYPGQRDIRDSTVHYCTIHTGQQLDRYGKSGSAWPSSYYTCTNSNDGVNPPTGNIFRYNVVYDLYGEAMVGTGLTAEYNVFGDSASGTWHHLCYDSACADLTIRYNIAVQSSSGTYDDTSGSKCDFFHAGNVDGVDSPPDNSNCTISVYGNIIINKRVAFRMNKTDSTSGDKTKGVSDFRIFNNIIIDPQQHAFMFNNTALHHDDSVQIYNNSVIYYSTINRVSPWGILWDDVAGTNLSSIATVDNNHYFIYDALYANFDCNDASDLTNTGDGDLFGNNCVNGDPLLEGEEKASPIDWIGIASGNAFIEAVDFTDIIQRAGSPLTDAGKNLSSWVTQLLTDGTNWNEDPSTSTWQLTTVETWDIGAYEYEEGATGIRGIKLQ